jgi:hypothetical protein
MMMTNKTKLLQSITAKTTGQRYAVDLDYSKIDLFIKEKSDEYSMPLKYADEYRIGVNIGCAVQISSILTQIEREKSIEFALKNIGRGISEEVYGEVRQKLIKLAVQLKREGRFGSPSHEMIEDILDMITYE